MADVSIIIPTYNERDNVEELLTRVTKAMNEANYHEFEIVVVDDNSPDGTADLVKSLSTRYPCQVNQKTRKTWSWIGNT